MTFIVDINGMAEMYRKGFIKGFTMNPTWMKKAGVTGCMEFVESVLKEIPDRPVSFEVFEDGSEMMDKEAVIISGYGKMFLSKYLLQIPGVSPVSR